MSAAVGVYIDPNDLRPVKKLRPHPKRCTIQNPDLDQVQLLIAECSKTCFVVAQVIPDETALVAMPIQSSGRVESFILRGCVVAGSAIVAIIDDAELHLYRFGWDHTQLDREVVSENEARERICRSAASLKRKLIESERRYLTVRGHVM